MASAAAVAAGPADHDRAHAGAVRDERLLQPHGLEGRAPRAPQLGGAGELQEPVPQPVLQGRHGREHPADRVSRARCARPGGGVRVVAGSQVLRPGAGADPAHHAVPADACGRRPRLEGPDVPRPVRRAELGHREAWWDAGGFRLHPPDALDHHRPHLAVDAVHDADHARRPAEPAERRSRGGEGRWGDAVRDLPPADAQPPAALHGAGHPARHHLPHPGLRPDRGDDRWRAGLDQPPVLRLRAIDRRRLGVRPGVVVQHRGRHRVDRHRDRRVARPVRAPERRGDRMSRAEVPVTVGERRWVNGALGVVAWITGLIFFFPVFWMVLNSFKSEQDANTSPKLFFHPTLERYHDVTKSAAGLLSFGDAFANSAVIVVLSTVIVLALAIPAAYALAVRPVHAWRDVLFFFISTKFLPVVASILPIWILAKNFNLLNTRLVLIILYVGINLPLAVWMLRSFFREIPRELIEAAEIDGASLKGQMTSIILPMAAPGIAATALLCVIFAWNEFFYAVQLNPVKGSTVPIWVTTNISTRGDFLAKLSAASVLACIPVVLAGWIAQKRMIRGLAMGAIK